MSPLWETRKCLNRKQTKMTCLFLVLLGVGQKEITVGACPLVQFHSDKDQEIPPALTNALSVQKIREVKVETTEITVGPCGRFLCLPRMYPD